MRLLNRYPGFRALWIGQFLSQMGNAVFFIMGLWEIQLRSPFLLSIAGLAMSVPAVLGILGGAVVDRYDPRKIMLLTDVGRGAAMIAGFAALAFPRILMPDIIVLLGVNSLGNTLFGPAEGVVVPWLVHDADLGAANGLYSITGQLSGAIGSAIGGASIAALGVATVFGLDTASFWLSVLAIAVMMRVVARPARPAGTAGGALEGRQTFGHMMIEGWKGLADLPWLVRLMPLIVGTNFTFSAAFTMLPYWSRRVLHGDALVYGIVSASWSAGIVLGGLNVGRFNRRALNGVTALVGVILGVGSFVFAVATTAWLSATILVILGAANGVINALLFTIMQRAIPEAIRGRTFGLFIALISVATPLGSLASGVTLSVLPLWWSWVLSGLVSIALGVTAWHWLPRSSPYTESSTQAL